MNSIAKLIADVQQWQQVGQSPAADGLTTPQDTSKPADQVAPKTPGTVTQQQNGLFSALGMSLQNVTQTQILTVTAAIIGVLYVIHLMRK